VGTYGDLFARLRQDAYDQCQRPTFPKNTKALSSALRHISDDLVTRGIAVEPVVDDAGKRRHTRKGNLLSVTYDPTDSADAGGGA
jgi:hypothetical protein